MHHHHNCHAKQTAIVVNTGMRLTREEGLIRVD